MTRQDGQSIIRKDEINFYVIVYTAETERL